MILGFAERTHMMIYIAYVHIFISVYTHKYINTKYFNYMMI